VSVDEGIRWLDLDRSTFRVDFLRMLDRNCYFSVKQDASHFSGLLNQMIWKKGMKIRVYCVSGRDILKIDIQAHSSKHNRYNDCLNV
jgi:hypothetical protein